MAREGLIYEKTHESPLNNRDGYYSNGNDPTISTEQARGTYALRHYVHRTDTPSTYRSMMTVNDNDDDPWEDGDNRNAKVFSFNDEYWIGLSFYLPSDWESDYQQHGSGSSNELIWQFQAMPDSGERYRSPILACYFECENRQYNPQFRIWIRGDTRSFTPEDEGPGSFTHTQTFAFGNILDYRGTWLDWIIRVYFNYEGNGYTQVWLNGDLVVDFSGVNASNDDVGPYMSFGVYKWGWRDDIFGNVVDRLYYFDELRIGRAALGCGYADVNPNPDEEPPGSGGGEPPPGGEGEVNIALARVACNTGTGTQDITTANLGDKTAKGAIFWLVKATSNGAFAADAGFGFGACDGSVQFAWAISAQDNQANTKCYRRGMKDKCICLLDPSDGSVLAEAEYSALITNGVRINWTIAPPSGYYLSAILFAGDDLAIDVLTFTPYGTVNGAKDVSDPGWYAQVVIPSGINAPLNDTTYEDAYACIGLAALGETDYQNCVDLYWQHGSSYTTYSRGQIATGRAIKESDNYSLELDGYSQGFTVITRGENADTNDEYGAVCLQTKNPAWCGVVDTPTSTGNQVYSGPDFEPIAVLALPTQMTSVDSWLYGDYGGGSPFVFAGWDASTDLCQLAVVEQDHSPNSNDASLSEDKAINCPLHTQGSGYEASYYSFHSTGFTLNFDTVLGSARKFVVLAFQKVETAGEENELAALGGLSGLSGLSALV